MEQLVRAVRRVCNAGLDAVSLRTEVARHVGRVVGFDAYAFCTHDPDTGLMTHIVAEGIPERLAGEYLEDLYPYQTALISLERARNGDSVFSMTEASADFAALLRGAGISHEFNLAVAAGGALWGSWCLLREGGPAALPARERAILERIIPHLVHGFRTAALLERASDPDDDDPVGVLLVDARGRPSRWSPAALRLLADLSDTGMQGDPDPLPVAVLSAVAHARHVGPRDARPDESMLRTRGRSGHWYTVRVATAEPDTAGETASIVTIQRAAGREKARLLADLYGLSAREREIVASVARGESTKRIATTLALSPHSVEEYLDRACEKVGAHGRRALVAKLFFDGYAPRLFG